MKQFPFVLGTDIVHLPRWDVVQNPKRVALLARRMLHPYEVGRIKDINHTFYEILEPPAESNFRRVDVELDAKAKTYETAIDRLKGKPKGLWERRLSTFLAGRWAAKEAARKAWGAHLVGFKDVRIQLDRDQNTDRCLDPFLTNGKREGSLGVKIVCQPYQGLHDREFVVGGEHYQEGRLSISHDGEYVVATVIAEPLGDKIKQALQQAKPRTTNWSRVDLRAVELDGIDDESVGTDEDEEQEKMSS